MQCSRLAAAGCIVTLLGSVAVSAQAPPAIPPTPAAASDAGRLSFKPFVRLFEQRRSGADAAIRAQGRPNFTRPNAVRPNSSRRFICSTPVLPVNPAGAPIFDSRPRDRTTQLTMRSTAPPLCH